MKPIVAHLIRGFLRPTETFVGNQLTSLRAYDSIVLCHHRVAGSAHESIPATTLSEELGALGLWFDQAAYRWLRFLTPGAAASGASLIEKSRAVLLHFHYLVDARFFLSLRRRLPLPAIVSGYGWDVSVFPKKHMGLGSRYLRPIFTEMQMFLAMSEDMREDLLELGCPRSKIVVHYHGIDTKRFRFPDRPYMKRPEVRVLFCARLAPKKSPETLIEAINILERDRSGDFPDLHVTLVGNGPSRAKLEELVDQYGLRRKVTFKGHIRHEDQALVREYHDADVFVLPSRTAKDGDKEGIPGTLVEALSAGLPVISTRHAGIPSVVKDGINGLLVEEGDSRAIAERLLVLLTDAELRRRLGLEAARTAAELDLEKRTRVLESIYSEAVKTWASVRRSSM